MVVIKAIVPTFIRLEPPMPTRVFNLGSINIDHVYQVPHFVRPGETLASSGYARHAGGKGYNQSFALARGGATVHHLGAIGPDGASLRDALATVGVNVASLHTVAEPTGHALIQIARGGENAILLHPGANHALTVADIRAALAEARPGDWFLTQNETSVVPEALVLAKQAGLRLALNPAPLTPDVAAWPLDLVDLLVVNETEGAALSGQTEPDAILATLRARHPGMLIVLTLGADGVRYVGPDGCGTLPAVRVQVVDTTAAGDTFIGFLLAQLAGGSALDPALTLATQAAALAVTRPGAASSIPTLEEVRTFAVR